MLTLKIEGRVISDWAEELDRVWSSLVPSLGPRKLSLDICGVTYIDDKGRQVLQNIVQATGAEILADSPLTKQFAFEVVQNERNSN